jgi:hypothetical protein
VKSGDIYGRMRAMYVGNCTRKKMLRMDGKIQRRMNAYLENALSGGPLTLNAC